MENRKDDTVSITSARPGRSVDLRNRQTRYLVSMMIRTVCFVLAVVASGPLRWIFIFGAVFLPYVAVIFANTSSEGDSVDPDVITPEPIGEIGSTEPRR
ncbi:DUF3099 domain-containing protein [Solicola sp. PLA-1-18]|uniref:DUF3099 domain-containing protein n=1 Tax=Solicola sp. PLA-1-18 TaxID=3380532 RepID=UPI003B7DC341